MHILSTYIQTGIDDDVHLHMHVRFHGFRCEEPFLVSVQPSLFRSAHFKQKLKHRVKLCEEVV